MQPDSGAGPLDACRPGLCEPRMTQPPPATVGATSPTRPGSACPSSPTSWITARATCWPTWAFPSGTRPSRTARTRCREILRSEIFEFNAVNRLTGAGWPATPSTVWMGPESRERHGQRTRRGRGKLNLKGLTGLPALPHAADAPALAAVGSVQGDVVWSAAALFPFASGRWLVLACLLAGGEGHSHAGMIRSGVAAWMPGSRPGKPSSGDGSREAAHSQPMAVRRKRMPRAAKAAISALSLPKPWPPAPGS